MLSSLWGTETDSDLNLKRRPSSLGGYLLKLKRTQTDKVHVSVAEKRLAPAAAADSLGSTVAAYASPFGEWNRRWINIEGHYIRWYNKVTSKQPSGSIDLRYVTCIRELREADLVNHKGDSPNGNTQSVALEQQDLDEKLAFLVESTERPLILRCSSPSEVQKWVRMLNLLVDRARGGDGTKGVPSSPQLFMAGSESLQLSAVPQTQGGASASTREGTTAAQTSEKRKAQNSNISSAAAEQRRRRKADAAAKRSLKSSGDATADSAPDSSSGPTRNVPTTPRLRLEAETRCDDALESPADNAKGSSDAGAVALRVAGHKRGESLSPTSTGVFHTRKGSQYDSHPPVEGLAANAANYDGTGRERKSDSGSIGVRIRRNIEENPVINDNNNGHERPPSASRVGNRPPASGVAGMVGLGTRRGIGYGTGADEVPANPPRSGSTTSASVKKTHTDAKLSAVPPPLPASSVPDAYRIKKEDIFKRLGANSPKPVKKAWETPDSGHTRLLITPNSSSPSGDSLIHSSDDNILEQSLSPEVNSITGVVGTAESFAVVGSEMSAVRAFTEPSRSPTESLVDNFNTAISTITHEFVSLESAVTVSSTDSGAEESPSRAGGLSYRIARSMAAGRNI